MDNQNPIANLSDFRQKSGEALSNLIADLNEHNSHHGPGAHMGKMLGKFLVARIEEGEVADMDKVGAEVVIESAQEARIGLSELQTKHGRILSRFGLSIAHQASEGLRQGLPSGPISIKITDPHAFLRYAQSVRPARLADDATSPLNTLLLAAENQIRTLDFKHLSPTEQNFLENLDALSGGFKLIDAGLHVKKLDTYAFYQKTGKLEQYIAVEREGLWQEPEKGFGPADWVKDISPGALDQYWQKAVEILKDQLRLDNQGGVGKELRDHLLFCMDKAFENLETIKWVPDYNHKEDFGKIMAKYREEIRSIS